MKKVTILKVILVLIIGTILIAKPINIFATDLNELIGNANTSTDSSDDTEIPVEDEAEDVADEDEYEDKGSLEDIKPEEETTGTQELVKPQTQTQTQTEEKEELPEAGIIEDTVMIVSVLALLSMAVFTFVKMSDYSNI